MEVLRRELGNRPLVLAAVTLCIGMTILLHPFNVLFLIPLFLARRPIPVALALAAGLWLTPRMTVQIPAPYWVDGKATVISVPQRTGDGGVRASIEVGQRKLSVLFPPGHIVVRGEQWHIRGTATPFNEQVPFLAEKGLEGEIRSFSAKKLSDGPWPWRIADGWKRGFESFAQARLKPVQARWLSAFAFRDGIFDEAEIDALRTTGAIHLVAASGIHVAALGVLCLWISTLLGCPRGATLAMVFVVLAFYAMATGLHMPTIRAVIAFTAGASAYVLRREPDGLSALASAVLIFLPFDPSGVYEMGFQLSVTVVGFLVLWPRRHSEEPPRTAISFFRQHARDVLVVSLIAAIAAEPIIAFYSGQISLLTVPANFFAVPVVMAAIVVSFVLHPLNAGWAMPFVGGLVSAAREAILWGGGLTGGVYRVDPFSAYWLTIPYGAWIWFWRPRAQACD